MLMFALRTREFLFMFFRADHENSANFFGYSDIHLKIAISPNKHELTAFFPCKSSFQFSVLYGQ